MSYTTKIVNPLVMNKPSMIAIESNMGKIPQWTPIDIPPPPPSWGGNTGVFGGFKDFVGFIQSVGDVGLFQTIYGKPFPQVAGEFILNIFKEIGIFITYNGDLLFLIPAIIAMLLTFTVGRNRFTKWIIPLWFLYFISRVFFRFLIDS